MISVLSGILFSISLTFVLRAAFATKLVVSDISLLTSVTFVFRAALLARLATSVILS